MASMDLLQGDFWIASMKIKLSQVGVGYHHPGTHGSTRPVGERQGGNPEAVACQGCPAPLDRPPAEPGAWSFSSPRPPRQQGTPRKPNSSRRTVGTARWTRLRILRCVLTPYVLCGHIGGARAGDK